MGSKIAKRRESDNIHNNLQSIPYSFVDTSKAYSSDVPNMFKNFFRSRNNIHIAANGPTSSLAFLMDENCLLFGSISLGQINNSYMTRRDREQSTCIADDLCLIDLHSGEMKNIINFSVRDVCVSFNLAHAAILVYAGFSNLQFWQFDRASNFQNCVVEDSIKNSLTSHATCCSISPNGKWLVVAVCSLFFTLGRGSYLKIYTLHQSKLKEKKSTSIERFAEIFINLEFTSDSQFLAIGTSAEYFAKVYFISTRTWQVIYNITENNLEQFYPFRPTFNPVPTCYQLITSTEPGGLVKWDMSTLYNYHTSRPMLDRIDSFNVSEGSTVPRRITSCPRFSPDGSMFAVPLSDGSVIILDPNLFETLWNISSPDFQLQQPEGLEISETLEVTSVCFSKSCEYLAVGHCRHFVSLWLLPRMHFNLKHLCRTKIISIYPPNLVHKLPIPEGLKQYLLYQL